MKHPTACRSVYSRPFASALTATTVVLVACATSTKSTDDPSSSGNGGGGSGAILGSSSGGSSSTGAQGSLTRCDDAGNCTSCTLSIASIGNPAHYGANGLGSDSTQAFTDWLNAESANASVDIYTTHPTLTADFLKTYNVLIIQWLKDSDSSPPWTFADDEVAALEGWVNAGGGLITLTGYDSNANEVEPVNRLLSFTDMSYDETSDTYAACPSGLECYCWGNSVPMGPWVNNPIGANVKQVGAFHGRAILPGSATVDCSDSTPRPSAAHEDYGNGHVFAFGDEWITYTSQWSSASQTNAQSIYTDINNPCYHQSASDVFQVAQLWYNAIGWAALATGCQFDLKPDVPIIRPK